MINKYLIIVFLSVQYVAFAQFGEQQLIDPLQPSDIKVGDINGDGTLDIAMADANTNTIAWYNNLDGLGGYGSINVVTNTYSFTRSLHLADLDGDLDLDIIASSKNNNSVVWFKNLDGLGNFSAAITITDNAMNAFGISASDIDNDGDIDVLSTSQNDSKIAWYKNLDGLGNFSNEIIISDLATGVYQIDVADLDGDGALDVLTNSSTIGFPSWHKNLDGLDSFGTEQLIDLNSTFKVIAKDIDNDGDQDLFKRELIDGINVVHWLENTDGLGNFEQRQQITDYVQTRNIFAADIDKDNDVDLLIIYVGNPRIAWFENEDGAGTFGAPKIIDDVVGTALFSADIDNDTYNDVIAATADGLVWYKNLTYLNTTDHLQNKILVYPNPVNNILQLTTNDIAIEQLKMYDIMGKQVLQINKLNNKQINLTTLQTGMYLLHIYTLDGILIKKVVKN